MKVTKKDLEKSAVELAVVLELDEFQPYIEKGAQHISEHVKIEGFRAGKVPYDILKQKVGEISILEEAAHIAIRKTIDDIFAKELAGRQPVGQPNVEITKLAPGNPLEYKVTISLLPTVALGEYKDLKIKREAVVVTDEDIEKTLKEIIEMRAKETLTDEPAQLGDKLMLNINISLDKVPVEGGQAKDVTVMLGKEYMVPGFDDKVVGIKKDEKREFKLQYPATHHQAHLAGKMVEFEVKATAVYKRELPALDEELAKEMHFKGVDDLKDAIKKNISADRERQADIKSELKMLEAIADKAKFGDIPDTLIAGESDSMMQELERNVVSQGGNFEDYLKHINKTKEELRLDLLPNAVKRIKTALIIREVGIIEKVEVKKEAIDEKLEAYKKMYAQDPEAVKRMAAPEYRRHLENMMFNDEVISKLKKWNYADTGTQSQS
ncbi:trigger factor [Candidatus Falkowbacteria bacterium HGW-Falkowbacteria-2]|uniref:Trigger factor n=1 Tax=Candidatus Falkowbacteria bacterium HGW-Falkowbacteria-2 TaxID=2013769 RepID=A0A2N2E1U7_9BACT|nr:MAG: trigger factor [Candidatus Falkowbacteria bacterium HGW-Falkowbacteria-2]